MHRDKIIEHIAHAMIIYDGGSGQKTWRELATAAYYAHINCLQSEELKRAPQISIGESYDR
jgi:hypothetical protein